MFIKITEPSLVEKILTYVVVVLYISTSVVFMLPKFFLSVCVQESVW
jgi:hypothetical protein